MNKNKKKKTIVGGFGWKNSNVLLLPLSHFLVPLCTDGNSREHDFKTVEFFIIDEILFYYYLPYISKKVLVHWILWIVVENAETLTMHIIHLHITVTLRGRSISDFLVFTFFLLLSICLVFFVHLSISFSPLFLFFFPSFIPCLIPKII